MKSLLLNKLLNGRRERGMIRVRGGGWREGRQTEWKGREGEGEGE